MYVSMDPNKKDKDKRRKDPFDLFGFDDKFFNDMFDDRMFDDFRKMAEEMFRMLSNAQPGKSYVRGYSLRIGPDGKPRLEEFGNHQIKSGKGESSISEEREPLTDIIEGVEDVAVTVEIPGVEKDDIDLRVTEEQLEITVDTPQRKYHKKLNLPANVLPKTTNATYKNGILDVTIKRKEKKKENDSGFKVDIN